MAERTKCIFFIMSSIHFPTPTPVGEQLPLKIQQVETLPFCEVFYKTIFKMGTMCGILAMMFKDFIILLLLFIITFL